MVGVAAQSLAAATDGDLTDGQAGDAESRAPVGGYILGTACPYRLHNRQG